MIKTTSDLILIAGTGANLVVDAGSKTTNELIMIVGTVGRKGSHITLINCNKKTTFDLILICRVYPNNLTLDFTDQ